MCENEKFHCQTRCAYGTTTFCINSLKWQKFVKTGSKYYLIELTRVLKSLAGFPRNQDARSPRDMRGSMGSLYTLDDSKFSGEGVCRRRLRCWRREDESCMMVRFCEVGLVPAATPFSQVAKVPYIYAYYVKLRFLYRVREQSGLKLKAVGQYISERAKPSSKSHETDTTWKNIRAYNILRKIGSIISRQNKHTNK